MESVTTISVFVWATGILGVIRTGVAGTFTTLCSSETPQLTGKSATIQDEMQTRKNFFTAQPSAAGVLPQDTPLRHRACTTLEHTVIHPEMTATTRKRLAYRKL